MRAGDRDDARNLVLLLAAATLVGLVVREIAAGAVGFGDSEALYACYAIFRAPAHLDHPGLIGAIAGAVGQGYAPTPMAAHRLTAILASVAPCTVGFVAWLLGGSPRASAIVGIATSAVPELAVGLFGLTPDVPLFFAWLSTLALLGLGFGAHPGSLRSLACFLAGGLTLGLACSAKVSGLALLAAFALVLTMPVARPHARTLAPWLALLLATLVFAPVALFEARTGWPMLRHRLVDTQAAAGVSLRNVGAVLGGQLLYVSPGLLAIGVALGVRLHRSRHVDALHALLWAATVVPLALLGGLSLWSRVAEPHWLAPAWLALPVAYAVDRGPGRWAPSRRASIVSIAAAFALSALVYAWVLVPRLVGLVPAAAYDPRVDIANELYGWDAAAHDVEEVVEQARPPLALPGEVVVVGAVWTVCAQLRAALPRAIEVGCAGDDVADFASWSPKSAWSRAELLVLVQDNRRPVDAAALFPDRVSLARRTRVVTRGGRVARTFVIEVLSRRAAG